MSHVTTERLHSLKLEAESETSIPVFYVTDEEIWVGSKVANQADLENLVNVEIQDPHIRRNFQRFLTRNSRDNRIMLPVYEEFVSKLKGDELEIAKTSKAYASWRNEVDEALEYLASPDDIKDDETFRRLVIDVCNKKEFSNFI